MECRCESARVLTTVIIIIINIKRHPVYGHLRFILVFGAFSRSSLPRCLALSLWSNAYDSAAVTCKYAGAVASQRYAITWLQYTLLNKMLDSQTLVKDTGSL